MRQASPEIETAYQLVEQFLCMVRERSGEQLAAWRAFVQASQLAAFDSFVTGVQHDQDAVLAGLTLPWSTGPVEGHVNRLKLIKRESGTVVRSSICCGTACSTILQREKRLKLQRQEPIKSFGGIVASS